MAGDKRKNLSLGVDLGNLPSRRREKKPKHKSSKPKDVQSIPLISVTEPVDVQIHDDPEPKDSPVHIPSVTKAHSSSLPSQQVPQNLIGNEDLAWERFGTAVTDTDVAACYNMSLKVILHRISGLNASTSVNCGWWRKAYKTNTNSERRSG